MKNQPLRNDLPRTNRWEQIRPLFKAYSVQIIAIVGGTFAMIFGFRSSIQDELTKQLLTIIGGGLISTGTVSFIFEWVKLKSEIKLDDTLEEIRKDIKSLIPQKQSEYYLMSAQLGSIKKLERFDFFKETGKNLMPILRRQELDDPRSAYKLPIY